MPNDHLRPVRPPSSYVSQSECRTALDCGTAWYAKWHLGARNTSPEGPAQRVGSLGHAAVAARILGRDPWTVMMEEAIKRRYITSPAGDLVHADWYNAPSDLVEHASLAAQADRTLDESGEWHCGEPVVNGDGEPLIERTMRATWYDLDHSAGLVLHPSTHLHIVRHRLGMEGTPDLVHLSEHRPGADIYLDDFKMRTRPVDGAKPTGTNPDSQGAFYKVLLRATGIDDGTRDVVFRQVQVYAGRWVTVDDFMAEGSPLVNDNGLPTRDEKRIRGMVKPEVWSEAWRLLAERRRLATLDRKGGPKVPTWNETEEARRFVAELGGRKAVVVESFRLDHSVCTEVVRDMVAAVADRLAAVDAGATPGRHLRTYPSSPCCRPFGCDVQVPCLSSLGSDNVAAVLREHASVGRYALAEVPEVGERDIEEWTL